MKPRLQRDIAEPAAPRKLVRSCPFTAVRVLSFQRIKSPPCHNSARRKNHPARHLFVLRMSWCAKTAILFIEATIETVVILNPSDNPIYLRRRARAISADNNAAETRERVFI
jgi:hypothetical protein